MLETANTRIDIQRLEREVRWDAQKYSYLWRGIDSLNAVGTSEPEPVSETTAESIAAAAAVSNVESPGYALQRYPTPLRWLARIGARVVLYLASIITHAQTHFNYHVVSALDGFRRRMGRVDESQQTHSGILNWVMKALPEIGDQLEDLRRDFEQEQRGVTARLSQADRERLDHGRELEVFRESLPRLERELQVLNRVVVDLGDKVEQQETRLAQQAARLSLQERLLTRSGDTRVTSEPVPVQVDSPRQHSAPRAELDGLYMVFEDQFRGSREEIRSRLAGYLPQVEECVEAVEGEGTAIDLGCGRGEWLELLGERGVRARGVDNNPGFLAQCEQLGLTVIESDAIEYLASLPDESVSIVSAFHLIEHLEFDVLVRMIDEIQRVLQRGGMLVFETPNPKNLIVGACNFYADPTHVRQVFPELLEFVVQSRGFHAAGIRYLNPHPEEQRLSSKEAPILARELNDLLSCARDFAVIAHK